MKCWEELTSRQREEKRADQSVLDELNTLEIPSCLLVSRLEDLRDATIFSQMLLAAVKFQGVDDGGHLLRSLTDATEATNRLQFVLEAGRRLLKDAWPLALRLPDTADRIAKGDRKTTAALAAVLCRCVDGRIKLHASRDGSHEARLGGGSGNGSAAVHNAYAALVGANCPPAQITMRHTASVSARAERTGTGCARKCGHVRRLPHREEAIVSWLRTVLRARSHGMRIATRIEISTADDVAQIFESGVVLCVLIERYEKIAAWTTATPRRISKATRHGTMRCGAPLHCHEYIAVATLLQAGEQPLLLQAVWRESRSNGSHAVFVHRPLR